MASKKFLGEGAYGKVYIKSKGIAAKQFEDVRFAVHEYCIGRFLRNCPYTVSMTGINLEDKEVYMKLYKSSLSTWLHKERTEAQKIIVLREILYGLCYYGDMRLVHADIKPGNILINYNQKGDVTELVIGDTGFLSLEGFSKVHNTTPSYRDQICKSDFRHDIYSLGILSITMFGSNNTRGKKSYEELCNIANKQIKNQHILKWTLLMIDPDRSNRPTARALLKRLFDITPPLQCHPGFPIYKNQLTEDQQTHIQEIFRERSPMVENEKHDFDEYINSRKKGESIPNYIRGMIYRSKIAYKACVTYINKHNIEESDYDLYAYATMMIFSSVFGRSGFTIKTLMTEAGVSSSIAYRTVKQLISDEDFVMVMFYTKKSCMNN